MVQETRIGIITTDKRYSFFEHAMGEFSAEISTNPDVNIIGLLQHWRQVNTLIVIIDDDLIYGNQKLEDALINEFKSANLPHQRIIIFSDCARPAEDAFFYRLVSDADVKDIILSSMSPDLESKVIQVINEPTQLMEVSRWKTNDTKLFERNQKSGIFSGIFGGSKHENANSKQEKKSGGLFKGKKAKHSTEDVEEEQSSVDSYNPHETFDVAPIGKSSNENEQAAHASSRHSSYGYSASNQPSFNVELEAADEITSGVNNNDSFNYEYLTRANIYSSEPDYELEEPQVNPVSNYAGVAHSSNPYSFPSSNISAKDSQPYQTEPYQAQPYQAQASGAQQPQLSQPGYQAQSPASNLSANSTLVDDALKKLSLSHAQTQADQVQGSHAQSSSLEVPQPQTPPSTYVQQTSAFNSVSSGSVQEKGRSVDMPQQPTTPSINTSNLNDIESAPTSPSTDTAHIDKATNDVSSAENVSDIGSIEEIKKLIESKGYTIVPPIEETDLNTSSVDEIIEDRAKPSQVMNDSDDKNAEDQEEERVFSAEDYSEEATEEKNIEEQDILEEYDESALIDSGYIPPLPSKNSNNTRKSSASLVKEENEQYIYSDILPSKPKHARPIVYGEHIVHIKGPSAPTMISVAALRNGVGCTHLTCMLGAEIANDGLLTSVALRTRADFHRMFDALSDAVKINNTCFRWNNCDFYFWGDQRDYCRDYDVVVCDCGVIDLLETDPFSRAMTFKRSKTKVMLVSGAPWDIHDMPDLFEKYRADEVLSWIFALYNVEQEVASSFKSLLSDLGNKEFTNLFNVPMRTDVFSRGIKSRWTLPLYAPILNNAFPKRFSPKIERILSQAEENARKEDQNLTNNQNKNNRGENQNNKQRNNNRNNHRNNKSRQNKQQSNQSNTDSTNNGEKRNDNLSSNNSTNQGLNQKPQGFEGNSDEKTNKKKNGKKDDKVK